MQRMRKKNEREKENQQKEMELRNVMDLNDDEMFGKVRKETRRKERKRITTTTEVWYCLVTWYRLSSTFLLSIDSFFPSLILSLSLSHSFSLPPSFFLYSLSPLPNSFSLSLSNFTFSFPFPPSPFIYFLFSKNHLASTWREESWYYCFFVGFEEVKRESEER